jgi:hypothetical protein
MSRAKAIAKRNPYDFYATPEWCYEKLDFPFHLFRRAHEPCRGDGRIVSFLEKKGLDVTSSEIREGEDFFDWKGETDLIFTNPPFSIAQEFLEHSLPRAKCVVMLLRINFLGSKKRYEFWEKSPLDALYVLSKRPSFTGKGTDATEYAWFIWQQEEYVRPGIYHVPFPTWNISTGETND